MFQSFSHLWDDYYAAKLSKREVNQFHNAATRQSSNLIDFVLRPNLLLEGSSSYICLSSVKNYSGRGPADTRLVIDSGYDPVLWAAYQYFTNPLRLVSEDDPDFASPSNRVIMAPYVILTLEYDVPDVAFFQQQLGWFRTPKHPLDSPIGKFVRDLRDEYRDFVGLNVTYSGSKSFHYHYVFATDLIAGLVAEPTSVRHGYQDAWRKLSRAMSESPHLNIAPDVHPDDTLRSPEAFRRLPMGSREIDKAHMFGVPEGQRVPQLVMWEHLPLDRSRKGSAATSIFEPSQFVLPPTFRLKPAGSKSSFSAMPTAGALAYCEDRMRAAFPSYPEFAGFREERGEFRAYFKNSLGDRNAASYMGADYPTVMIQGDNPDGLTSKNDGWGTLMPRLPRPLGQMIERWTAEYEAQQAAPFQGRERTPVEAAFARAATNHATATAALSEVLDGLLLTSFEAPEAHFITAPEGISKTRSLIQKTPGYYRRLIREQKPGLIMYAFASYDMAEEKAAEFNAANNPHGLNSGQHLKAVVLPSFTRLYEEAIHAVGVGEITTPDAARRGFSSRLAAIRALQPEVMTYMGDFYGRLWRDVGQCQPVIFTVHQVAHGWVTNTPSRLMLSPLYWREEDRETEQDRQLRLKKCREQTRLGMLIHDEIAAESLLLAIPLPWLAWVEAMKEQGWSSESLADQFGAFTEASELAAPPQGLTFELSREIAEIEAWEAVTTQDSGEYGKRVARKDTGRGVVHEDIYAATAGKDWVVHVRPWPTQTAFKTVILTTEAIPMHIVRRIDTAWTVTELDTPLIPRDAVETHVSKEVRSDRFAALVKEWQDRHLTETGRQLLAISNKAKVVTNTRTHASAKGSNAYMGEDVIQTAGMMAPEQFEFYEALNAWTGRTDMVRTRHIDEFNQSAGRNLGFRKRGDPKHILLINSTLWECLEGEPMSRARYVMQETLSRRSLNTARKLAKKARIGKLAGAKSKTSMADLRNKIAQNRK